MSNPESYTEESYEQTLIALFRDELGYSYEYGYDVERDTHEPFHREVLQASLRRLNPHLSDEAIEDVMRQVSNIGEGGIVQSNERFTEMIQGGIDVQEMASSSQALQSATRPTSTKQDLTIGRQQQNLSIGLPKSSARYTMVADDTDLAYQRTVKARLIDFVNVDNNDFRICNQWVVEELRKVRCDMVVLVNGLPLVVIELKAAGSMDANIEYAYNQVRNYMQFVPSLFAYNAFSVISDMAYTKAGTITASLSRYMDWKAIDGSYESTLVADYKTFFLGLFERKRLLNILHNYICFDKNEGDCRKIMTAYHQYYAVEKAVARAHQAVSGNGKIGVFWHTQGSGKSFSMVFFAQQLIQQLPECTILVVTDRKDLDNQLYAQFARCQDFLRQTPAKAESREELRTLLKGRMAGGVIFTTIQKFEEGDDCLSDRRNIIVMTDEAHRSQYGDEHWDQKSGSMKKGFAMKMREALPHASFIGFTGTPISDRDRDTEEVFGSYIDIYDMTQAVNDNATRPVYYESRVINLNLDQETLDQLDREFDALAEEGATDDQILQAKHDNSHLEQILGDDKTISSLVTDIIRHYEENRAQELTGKAMIVALTRGIAIKIYRKMLELRPAWDEKVKVVMSTSNKDPEEWTRIIGNENYKKELARKFKDNDDPMKIAIVRDMWLTGFDVPSLATMYVYKPMKGHNLMQAIARVNRVFPGKEGGLIVDYVGIAQALQAAMRQYTQRDQNRFGDTDIARTARVKWQEEMEICRDLMYGYDYSPFFGDDNTLRSNAISEGANFLSAPMREETQKQFVEHSRYLHNATTLCRSILTPQDKTEVVYFDVVRTLLLKLTQPGKITKRDINERIQNLISQSIQSQGVINLFGNTQTEFSLFNEAFIQELRKMKEKNLAIRLLEKLLRQQIRHTARVNVVSSERFSDMLSLSLSQYLKGMLTNEEVIEELLKLAQTLKQDEEAGNELGLSPEEKAFYDALSRPEGCRRAFNDEDFLALTKELTETLRKNRTIDWNRKDSARAQMRLLVKRLLRKYHYPPEGCDEALDIVMRQCDHWADQEENF